MKENSQVTYSIIMTKLKQMEKVQIKTMEILNRIENLLDIEEEEENKPIVAKPPFYYHPDER